MSMLLKSVNPEAAEAIGNIKKVGIGNPVVYHARQGYMRDRRLSFPALVLRQNEDDGSLDLLVFMEREEFAFEQRVQFRGHNQPHHCWSAVEDVPAAGAPQVSGSMEPDGTVQLFKTVKELTDRIAALETKRGPGRPAKSKAD